MVEICRYPCMRTEPIRNESATWYGPADELGGRGGGEGGALASSSNIPRIMILLMSHTEVNRLALFVSIHTDYLLTTPQEAQKRREKPLSTLIIGVISCSPSLGSTVPEVKSVNKRLYSPAGKGGRNYSHQGPGLLLTHQDVRPVQVVVNQSKRRRVASRDRLALYGCRRGISQSYDKPGHYMIHTHTRKSANSARSAPGQVNWGGGGGTESSVISGRGFFFFFWFLYSQQSSNRQRIRFGILIWAAFTRLRKSFRGP